MPHTDTLVFARVDSVTLQRAKEALEAEELSVSDAICMLMTWIARERCLPFEIKAPNSATQAAIDELESGNAKAFDSIDALMADLNAVD